MRVCYIAKVTGEVQGVYFRSSAQSQAIDLSLAGYAHNQDDGSVEIMVCGEESNVMQMLEWIKEGPPDAHVENVTIEATHLRDINHFAVG
ncbi:acylphosphatase [Thalassotalea ponticola]|uniref:acylphosphatase n=1 Tax=Thalassotalea ponticola TaxID=1523392 RepID=UPI0025B5D6D0|nr:acylphosphatase [Thalassotalea ponticola]MDN3653104.1 acylphosphatase [Thalassotalea ponticola]